MTKLPAPPAASVADPLGIAQRVSGGSLGECVEPSVTLPGLIVGLGNCLMRDDGIGVHVVRELMRDPPEGTLVLEVGTDVFSALSWMEEASWVLAIDAMEAGGAPGTVYTCATSEIAAPALPKSLHELGLLAVMEFLPPRRRPEITIVGVEPEIVDYGLELSPALGRALPATVEAVRALAIERPKKRPLKQ